MNPLTATASTSSTPHAEAVHGTGAFAALRSGAYMVLDQYGLIGVEGADAASFLHNLLTNDIQALPEERARLAGFCTPKGRLLASMLAWRDAQAIHLMLSAELAEPIRKRLSMFVLRAKATLHDALATTRLIGLCIDAGTGVAAGEGAGPGAGAAASLAALLAPHFDALPAQPYDVSHGGVHASGSLLRLPDAAGLARYLWAAPAALWEACSADWPATLAQLEPHTWDWLAVQAGEPRITAATQEKFVPQMINFEVIGGVNFKKGCYPGQEIVARSQYLGTIKRRAMLAHLDDAAAHAAAPGVEVYNSDDPAQPCGLVINAAGVPGAAGSLDCLIEIKLDALTHGSVHLGRADGPLLSVSQPPYAFPGLDAA
jgi:folate-binding protein YgfZ